MTDLFGAQQHFESRRVTVPAESTLEERFDFRPDQVKFLTYVTLTSRIDIELSGMKRVGAGYIPIFLRGPVDVPGFTDPQIIRLHNRDTSDRDVLIVAWAGYLPTGINTPTTGSITEVGDLFAFEWQIDGQGSPPAAQVYPVLDVPFPCTIQRVRLIANTNGTIQIDLNRNTFAGYPSMSSIAASAIPALSTADTYEDTTLTGWTLDLAQGDVLQPEVDASPAPATLSWVLLSLWAERTG